MSLAGHQNVPAAWYPDQSDPRQLRWWDGHSWTGEVRPAIALVPEAAPTVIPTPSAAQLEARRSLHAAPQPAQGFGHATPEQLRSWPAPSAHERNQLPTSVNELPRQWGMSTRDDATKSWFEESQKPVQFVPRLADSKPSYVTQQSELFDDADESVFVDTLESTIEILSKTRKYSDFAGLLDEEFPERGSLATAELPVDLPVELSAALPVELPTELPTDEAMPPVWRGVDETPRVEANPAPVPSLAPAPIAAPVGLTRRQLREMVGPLTTASDRD